MMVVDYLKLNIAPEDIGTELAETVRGNYYPWMSDDLMVADRAREVARKVFSCRCRRLQELLLLSALGPLIAC